MNAENITQYVTDIEGNLQPMTNEQRRFIDRELWYTGIKTNDLRLTPRAYELLVRYHSVAHNVFKHEAAELIDFLLDVGRLASSR